MQHRRPNGTQRNYDPLNGLVFARSQAEFVWDVEGNKYVDMIGGYSACNLGHGHPRLVEAACQQLNKLTWAHGGESLERQTLENALACLWDQDRHRLASEPSKTKVWLTLSGARAIEIAWKIAYANKPGAAVRLDLAYHGRSLATAYLSDTDRSGALGPTDPLKAPSTIPFPRHPHGACGPILADGSANRLCKECLACLQEARSVFAKKASISSMLFIEPAIGARGYYFAAASFMQQLVELARSYGLTIISDEIQMGLRRTGPMFAGRAQGWEADIVVLGKSLGGGIAPIAAVIADSHWIDSLGPGIESETFAAYPLACRIAIETLEILQDKKLPEEIERKGRAFRNQLRTQLAPEITVDGVGLASCISLENLPLSGIKQAYAIVKSLATQGVLVHLTGPMRNRIALIPSLLISDPSLEDSAKKIIHAFG
ncbi:MAG: aminotransferase class III-fold pyridoxal phosphate-dependent enzyme [Planctomycetota bacterium]